MNSLTVKQNAELMNAKTDEGKAKLVSIRYPAQFTYNTAFGLMAWNGSYWIGGHDAEVKLSSAISETFTYLEGLAESSGWRQEDINLFATNYNKKQACKNEFIRLPEIASNPEDFNKHDDLLPVENGVIDLRTGALLPHDPKYRFTFVCPVEYKPQADTSVIEKFLSDSIEHYGSDSEVKEFFQKSLGYMLTGDTSQEIYFYVWGRARSGKGTLAEMVQAIMGDCGGAANFDSFTRKRTNGDQGFDIAPLHNKRVIFASESDKNQRMNESFIKTITGNDKIQVSFKGQTPFTFKPKWKLVFMSNHQIAADPDDSAFWVRTRLINFPNGHDEETQDPKYKAALLEKSNLEAMLAFMVQGSIMFYQEEKIAQPAKLKELKKERRLQLDTVQQWLDENTLVATLDNGWGASKLHSHYENWCNVNGYDSKEIVGTLKSFCASLRSKGYMDKRTSIGVIFNIQEK